MAQLYKNDIPILTAGTKSITVATEAEYDTIYDGGNGTDYDPGAVYYITSNRQIRKGNAAYGGTPMLEMTKAQYDELIENDTVIIDGVVYNYDPEALYFITDYDGAGGNGASTEHIIWYHGNLSELTSAQVQAQIANNNWNSGQKILDSSNTIYEVDDPAETISVVQNLVEGWDDITEYVDTEVTNAGITARKSEVGLNIPYGYSNQSIKLFPPKDPAKGPAKYKLIYKVSDTIYVTQELSIQPSDYGYNCLGLKTTNNQGEYFAKYPTRHGWARLYKVYSKNADITKTSGLIMPGRGNLITTKNTFSTAALEGWRYVNQVNYFELQPTIKDQDASGLELKNPLMTNYLTFEMSKFNDTRMIYDQQNLPFWTNLYSFSQFLIVHGSTADPKNTVIDKTDYTQYYGLVLKGGRYSFDLDYDLEYCPGSDMVSSFKAAELAKMVSPDFFSTYSETRKNPGTTQVGMSKTFTRPKVVGATSTVSGYVLSNAERVDKTVYFQRVITAKKTKFYSQSHLIGTYIPSVEIFAKYDESEGLWYIMFHQYRQSFDDTEGPWTEGNLSVTMFGYNCISSANYNQVDEDRINQLGFQDQRVKPFSNGMGAQSEFAS